MRHRHRRANHPHVMFDAVTPETIPTNAGAVAGYVDGAWQTVPYLQDHFGHARILSITVFGHKSAHALDVEVGDAGPEQVVPWIHDRHKAGIKHPKVYANLSTWVAIIQHIDAAGMDRGHYRIWTAHPTGHAHLCGPECFPGFDRRADGTQFDWTALGRNLDESRINDRFFD